MKGSTLLLIGAALVGGAVYLRKDDAAAPPPKITASDGKKYSVDDLGHILDDTGKVIELAGKIGQEVADIWDKMNEGKAVSGGGDETGSTGSSGSASDTGAQSMVAGAYRAGFGAHRRCSNCG